jgi:hypothetical protein
MYNPGYYIFTFKDDKIILNSIEQDLLNDLITKYGIIEWFHSSTNFNVYGTSIKNMYIVPEREISFKGVF